MGIVACTTFTKMNSFVVLSAILGATMAAPAADADAQLLAGHGLLGAGYAGVGLAGHGLVAGHAGLAGVGLAGHGLAYAAPLLSLLLPLSPLSTLPPSLPST